MWEGLTLLVGYLLSLELHIQMGCCIISFFPQDASFGVVKLATDPTQTTDGLFVLKLSEAGTLVPPMGVPPLSPGAQTSLHGLLLSWLSTLAAIGGGPAPPLPVRVTGLLQTVISGARCLVVGVASSPVQPGTEGSVGGRHSMLQDVLTRVTLLEALGSTLGFASKYLPSAILEELESVLVLPLSAILMYQEDVGPLLTHLSFYWHSLYTAANHPTGEAFKSQVALETTVCAVPLSPWQPHPPGNPVPSATPSQAAEVVLAVWQRVHRAGLDIAGVRLVYDQSAASVLEGKVIETEGGDATPDVPVLILALRGPDAVHALMDVLGPKDVSLARITDPGSINGQFGGPDWTVAECVRTPYAVGFATALCFGGRACVRTSSVLGVSDPATKSERRKRQRVRFSDSESDELSHSSESPTSSSSSPSSSHLVLPPLVSNLPTLVVPPYGSFVLALSPHVSPSLYPSVMATCSRLGYDLLGVKRLRLNQKRATSLGLPVHCMAAFTPSSSSSSPPSTSPLCVPRSSHHPTLHPSQLQDGDQGSPPLPSTFLLLGRENALLHSAALVEAVLGDLATVKWACPGTAPTSTVFESSEAHAFECCDAVLGMLGGFSLLPPMINIQAPLPSQYMEGSGYQEEVCVVAATQSNGLLLAVQFLSAVFGVQGSPLRSPSELFHNGTCLGDTAELGGLELLGMKLVPQLSRYHAKQLCPVEPSSPFYQAALNTLSDAPVLLIVLRGLQCNVRVQRLMPELVRSVSEPRVSLIASASFQHAYNLMSVFFTDKELFCDFKGRVLSQYTPCPSIDSILSSLQDPVQPLCSVFSVPISQEGLLVRVMEKLCRAGFNFVGMTCHYGDKENGMVEVSGWWIL